MHELQSKLEQAMGYVFKNPGLLKEALTHKSFVAEWDSEVRDNQRLEFLGDAVVQIVTSTHLFETFPDFEEGTLTKTRVTLTREETLVVFAKKLDLGAYLRLGKGEEMADGRNRNSALCDMFEAVVAAVYLDSGKDLAVVSRLLLELVGDVDVDPQRILEDNPKGALQEWTQKHVHCIPQYDLIETSGPDHEKEFVVDVLINERRLGTGTAKSLKHAEQQAALIALETLKEEEEKEEVSND
jgi:ribonuclease-3